MVADLLTDSGYPRLKSYILDQTGLSYYEDKDEDLAVKISGRMSARAVTDCCSYLRLIAHEQNEMEALVGELTIGETYFFRQPEQFELLRKIVVPDVVERNTATRRIRIWSAGCATGAEPYSLAVMLRLDFAAALADWNVSILATDINIQFLERAKTGIFADWALRQVPNELKQRCFAREGTRWKLQPEYRTSVVFRYHNLASASPYPGEGDPFDIIICRNVLIYFSREKIREVSLRFHGSLAESGWLLVGHAEPHAETFREYAVVWDCGASAYRKSAIDALPRPWSPSPLGSDDASDVSYRIALGRLEPRILPAPAPAEAHVAGRGIVQTGVLHPVGAVEEARVLADRGEWSRAEEICQALIEANPLNAAAHFTLGLVLEHTATPLQAQSAFRRAIYLDRTFVMAHYHLGISLQQGRNNRQARKTFHNVLRLLEGRAADEPLPHGHGMTSAEMMDLAKMHLDLVGGHG